MEALTALVRLQTYAQRKICAIYLVSSCCYIYTLHMSIGQEVLKKKKRFALFISVLTLVHLHTTYVWRRMCVLVLLHKAHAHLKICDMCDICDMYVPILLRTWRPPPPLCHAPPPYLTPLPFGAPGVRAARHLS